MLTLGGGAMHMHICVCTPLAVQALFSGCSDGEGDGDASQTGTAWLQVCYPSVGLEFKKLAKIFQLGIQPESFSQLGATARRW